MGEDKPKENTEYFPFKEMVMFKSRPFWAHMGVMHAMELAGNEEQKKKKTS